MEEISAEKEKVKFINFGDEVLKRVGLQTQYASRYLFGVLGSENLGEGLRFEGPQDDYYEIKIHSDDLEIFIQRLIALKKSKGVDLLDNK